MKKKLLIGLPVVILIAVIICLIITFFPKDYQMKKKAAEVKNEVSEQIDKLSETGKLVDREVFVTISDMAIVGYISIPTIQYEYAVANIFDENTKTSTICRTTSSMPWELDGMNVSGLEVFTKQLEELSNRTSMTFTDVTGRDYAYVYAPDSKSDYSITINQVDDSGSIVKSYVFEAVNPDEMN